MVNYFEIVIALICICLVYKSLEIFQIAYVTDKDNPARKRGMRLGIFLTICAFALGAIVAAALAFLEWHMDKQFEQLKHL